MDNYKTWLKTSGLIGICCGVLVSLCALGLKHYFGYPDIIRAQPDIIMEKLYATRSIVPYLYYFGVGGMGVLVIFFSIGFTNILKLKGESFFSEFARVCGIISGLLLFVGIIRYSILFPRLATLLHEETYSKEALNLAFITMNTYIGESVAEHAQFFFTALMLIFFALASRKARLLPSWINYSAIIIAVIDIIGNFEHFGFSFAFAFNRIGPMLFALWLTISGILLVLKAKHYKE